MLLSYSRISSGCPPTCLTACAIRSGKCLETHWPTTSLGVDGRGGYLEQVAIHDLALRLWRPRWAVWTAHVVRSGGLIRDGIPTTQPLTPEVAAGLPGRPQAVFSPGHTNGHCSYLVDGVLASGDALVTGHPLIRHDGPQLLRAIFSYSQQACIQTLSVLAQVDSEILAPGHGPLWRGPVREATDAALKRALAR